MWKKYSDLYSALRFYWKKKYYQAKPVEIAGKHYFVRLIKCADIQDLLAIQQDVYSGKTPWNKAAFLSELFSGCPHLYLLIKQKEAIGFIGCRIRGDDAHITNIAIRISMQGQGIGSFLIQEVKKFAKEFYCKQLSLEVRSTNIAAQNFYLKHGFVLQMIHKGYYQETNDDALEMTLPLIKRANI